MPRKPLGRAIRWFTEETPESEIDDILLALATPTNEDTELARQVWRKVRDKYRGLLEAENAESNSIL
jgi:hypothetical protein